MEGKKYYIRKQIDLMQPLSLVDIFFKNLVVKTFKGLYNYLNLQKLVSKFVGLNIQNNTAFSFNFVTTYDKLIL